PDRLVGEVERARAGRAIVVDVVDRNAGQAELVDGALAAGRVTVHVTDEGFLDLLVRDAGVFERLLARFLGHLGIIVLARLVELRHPDAGHTDLAVVLHSPVPFIEGWIGDSNPAYRSNATSPRRAGGCIRASRSVPS